MKKLPGSLKNDAKHWATYGYTHRDDKGLKRLEKVVDHTLKTDE